MRDEHFNKYRPVVPQGKAWQVKSVDQPVARPVKPTAMTDQTSTLDRLDRPEQPIRLVEPSAKSTAESAVPVLTFCVDEVEPAPPAKEDEELVDYEVSPERSNLEINVVHVFRLLHSSRRGGGSSSVWTSQCYVPEAQRIGQPFESSLHERAR